MEKLNIGSRENRRWSQGPRVPAMVENLREEPGEGACGPQLCAQKSPGSAWRWPGRECSFLCTSWWDASKGSLRTWAPGSDLAPGESLWVMHGAWWVSQGHNTASCGSGELGQKSPEPKVESIWFMSTT